MREILFRGKRSGCGTWEYGAVATHIDGTTYIICPNFDIRVVNPHTLGQYTGLKDKKGKRIFEGDIVRHYTGAIHPVVFEQKNGSAFFGLAHTPRRGLTLPFWDQYPHHFEIIGNVHDNPDLLEV